MPRMRQPRCLAPVLQCICIVLAPVLYGRMRQPGGLPDPPVPSLPPLPGGSAQAIDDNLLEVGAGDSNSPRPAPSFPSYLSSLLFMYSPPPLPPLEVRLWRLRQCLRQLRRRLPPPLPGGSAQVIDDDSLEV